MDKEDTQNEAMTLVQTEQKQPSIALTLNGGKSEMNAPTIPVEWWFSDNVIRDKPTHILLVEQEAKEMTEGDDDRNGRRYLFPIDNSVAFIQLFSAGSHRIRAIVFKSREAARQYLKTDRDGSFEQDITDSHMQENAPGMGSTEVQFEVPAGLFATPVREKYGKLGEIGWYWVSLWVEEPKDECQFLRWLIPSLLWKPALKAVLISNQFVAGLVHALYVLLASTATLFAGFRPRPILTEMWDAIFWNRSGWSVRRYTNSYMVGNKPLFRLWSYKNDTAKYMWFAPWQAVFGVMALIFGTGSRLGCSESLF